jgi:hypothetical protein
MRNSHLDGTSVARCRRWTVYRKPVQLECHRVHHSSQCFATPPSLMREPNEDHQLGALARLSERDLFGCANGSASSGVSRLTIIPLLYNHARPFDARTAAPYALAVIDSSCYDLGSVLLPRLRTRPWCFVFQLFRRPTWVPTLHPFGLASFE